MATYHNIESRVLLPHHSYRVGYAKSDGRAVRVYGDSKHGYTVDGKYCRTLAEASAYLETL